ncbi:MAG: DUF2306 domain-containing protein [Bacteroidetes bacterium]|nr:DUF2306 domain-containing protein [Bacteroidota bacterium]
MMIVLKYTCKLLLWIPIVFFSILMAMNTWNFFYFDTTRGFLSEKTEALKDVLWLPLFYIHISSGILLLLVPIVNFSRRLLRCFPKMHVTVGKIYVYLALYLVAPSGMYLSFFAKEGFWSMLGFFVTGLCLVFFTYWGWVAMKKNNVWEHIEWMSRSYAVVASAITFRILHIVFYLWDVDYHYNYILSVWLSLLINLLLVEIMLLKKHEIKALFKSNNSITKTHSI